MKLTVQKRLAASILGCSQKRVVFVAERLPDIKEAITKADIRSLIAEGVITKLQEQGVSRGRARYRARQRHKGLQRGPGKRKGKKTALVPKKELWMAKIRVQRRFLKELKTKSLLRDDAYKQLYNKAKGGFFRNKRHIKIYIKEHDLAAKE